ncbi:hypothetical protein GCM10009119_31290 [Algoriphagus jejuensis]|uniref:Lipoprotein n=1 Tax=Algoriphagus jejuensis TaxID=419934 RepID=A0ABP3YFJ9_9BACT
MATFALCASYLLLLLTFACIDQENLDQGDGCPRPLEADAIDIKQVFFSPYSNKAYATASDTVFFSEFGFNFELEIQEKEMSYASTLPGQALALSCIRTYTIRNISNIAVILLEPFAGLPIGTDIAYALITPENNKLSQLREFENVSIYFGTRLTLTPENYSQLKTRTFLFLKNGTQKTFDSTSPFLKTN